ncbi:MAG: hypothetical protein SGJ24_17055 [Chloroflexota bacterium]|nr:hypothetical protein [Chloroflexota bacterium]
MTDHDLGFEPLYPDVLSAIAGGLRLDLTEIQAAVGVFPRSVYFNQPVEVIVILQNMIDSPVEVRVDLQAPAKDQDGAPVRIAAPKGAVTQVLSGGEVGVLRLPILPQTPTRANSALPIEVSVHARSRGGRTVRPPTGGAPPSVLSVSPFKMQALREVEFADPTEDMHGDNIVVRFDLASRQMPAPTTAMKTTYEPLWTREHMQEERQHIGEHLDAARMVATTFVRREVFSPLLRSTDELFALNGLPLHPGESRAIAKLLTHTLSDRSESDPAFRYEDLRWFQALAQTLAHDPTVARWEPGEIVGRYLYESLVYDAALLGFALIRPRVRINLGDRAERITYANKLIRWLAGQLPADLTYLYLPLVMGGVVVNPFVTGQGDDPWALLADLREAYRGRIRLADARAHEIFELFDKLLTLGEDDLRRARITHP